MQSFYSSYSYSFYRSAWMQTRSTDENSVSVCLSV